MRRRQMLASAFAAAVFTTASVPTVRAQSGINIGTLSCQVAGGWGWVIGSARPVLCSFDRYGAPPERYVGTMYKLGLDLGYTQGGALIWGLLRLRDNRPLGLGLLIGLLIVDLSPFILGLLLGLVILLQGGLRNA